MRLQETRLYKNVKKKYFSESIIESSIKIQLYESINKKKRKIVNLR